MIERVVVPVDFSAESDRALVTAPVLASWAGADVELLTVVKPSEGPDVEPKLAETARRLGNETTFRVVESGGLPEAVLLTELHAGRKELWCIGSHAAARSASCSSRASAKTSSAMPTCPLCSSAHTAPLPQPDASWQSRSTARARARTSSRPPPTWHRRWECRSASSR